MTQHYLSAMFRILLYKQQNRNSTETFFSAKLRTESIGEERSPLEKRIELAL